MGFIRTDLGRLVGPFWWFVNVFYFLTAFGIDKTIVGGCLLSEHRGWTPAIGLEERSKRADIVLTAQVLRTTQNDSLTDGQTYEAELRLIEIFKVPNEVELTSSFNVSNFGSKSLCYSSVQTGNEFIFFLTIVNGSLTAKYDDIYGATADLSPSNVDAVLKGVGLGYWSEWTSCSATCGGGLQERQRLCTPSQRSICHGIEKEKRKCNTFSCTGIRDLLKIFNFAKPGRRGVRPLTSDRPGAFRIDRYSHLRLPTYTLFPYSEYFPANFSILTSVRISDRGKEAGGGNFLGITDEHGRRRMALRLGSNKIEFVIVNEPVNNDGHRRTSSVSLKTKKSKQNYFRLTNASIGDFQWHAVSIGIQNDRINFYIDCELHSSFPLKRNYAGVDIAVASILTIGYLPNTIRDLNFEGDVEQLLIVTDSKAAEGHCQPAIKISEVDAEPLVMDESYWELPIVEKEVSSVTLTSSTTSTIIDNVHEWVIIPEGSGDSSFEIEWSKWSSCSVTCGHGHRKRTSYCLDNGQNLEECIDSMKEKSETKPCFLKECSLSRPIIGATVVPSKPWSNKRYNGTTPRPAKLHRRKNYPECKNGGICLSKDKCQCAPGYYGHLCEHVNCLGCFNGGRCVKPNLCTCQSGFKGNRCQEVVCKISCENGGRRAGPDRCICPYGYAPPICTPICNPPCYNDGICVAPSRCKCSKGFAGTSCKTAVCKNGCKNGGHCVAPERCACPSGYTGNDCSIPVCQPRCINGGRCVKPYTCLCKPGFGGLSCKKVMQCNPPCSNGGTCIGTNRCSCLASYIGNHCQIVLCTIKCENKGKCIDGIKCSCPAGFHGNRCENKKCKKFQMVREPFQRNYKKKVINAAKDVCRPWNWKTCQKSKVEYVDVSKTSYRMSYKCID